MLAVRGAARRPLSSTTTTRSGGDDEFSGLDHVHPTTARSSSLRRRAPAPFPRRCRRVPARARPRVQHPRATRRRARRSPSKAAHVEARQRCHRRLDRRAAARTRFNGSRRPAGPGPQASTPRFPAVWYGVPIDAETRQSQDDGLTALRNRFAGPWRRRFNLGPAFHGVFGADGFAIGYRPARRPRTTEHCLPRAGAGVASLATRHPVTERRPRSPIRAPPPSSRHPQF